MKKVILFLIFILTVTISRSQISITGSLGYGLTQFKPGLLNDFVSSYNKYYSETIEQEFSPFQPLMHSYSYGFGLQAKLEKSWMNFEYTKVAYSQSIESFLKSRFGRTIELRFADWNFLFDNTFGSERFRFGPVYGVSMRSGVIYSASNWYGSENQSFGHEFALNGIFRGIVQTNLLAGLVARVQIINPLFIQFRAFYTFPFMGNKENHLGAFSDSSPGKNPSLEYFPRDVYQFFANASLGGYDYENNVIPMSFRGLNASASLVFQLNFKEK